MNIPYTICFCICKNKVLMIFRNRPPNKDTWNAIGGKIETGESHYDSVFREVMEEAGIDLHTATTVKYGGVVYWKEGKELFNSNRGIHTYLAYFDSMTPWKKKSISEGILEWKDLDWICDKTNLEVVDNLPAFLPDMLKADKPYHYFCDYKNGILQKVICQSLKKELCK